MLGLSVTELASFKKIVNTYSKVSRDAPCTCGIHLNEYGSWTCDFFCDAISLPANNLRNSAAVSTCPLCDLMLCTFSLKQSSTPSKASNEIAEIISAHFNNR